MANLRMLSFNSWLIIANVAIFLVQMMGGRGVSRLISNFGHFSTLRMLHAEVWRVVTFQFLHANVMHLVFNMIGLFIFGGLVERHLGFKKYGAFYLVCGICGGLMYMLLNVLGSLGAQWGVTWIPGLIYPTASSRAFVSDVPLVGASAGVFGVIMASARIAPDLPVRMLFPPVEMRLRTLAYVYVGIALVNVLLSGENAGGDAAHIGGAIAGYFFVHNSHMLADFFDILGDSRNPGAKGGKAVRAVRRLAPNAAPDTAEIDRILDNVRDHGLSSLTDREKSTLRKATERQREANGF